MSKSIITFSENSLKHTLLGLPEKRASLSKINGLDKCDPYCN